VLFPDIELRRTFDSDTGDAVLIFDGCTCHESDWFLDEAVAKELVLHCLAPHSSDKTPPLDLGLFGITKQATRKVRADPD
jgi:hypothetical protein